MSTPSTAALPVRTLWSSGWLNGLIGVLIFSASLPATRVAVLQLDPLFLTFARAAIAGVLGLASLRLGRAPRPQRADLAPLAIVAAGVVLGFPLLTALALRHVTSAHAIAFLGLLPLATAAFAVARAGESARGSVASSDAFFPFPDGLQVLLDAGVRAVVQPGGSVRDAEVLAAAEQAGVSLYLTGARHFYH